MNLVKRQELFQNPTRQYRGKPFWSWNGKLEEQELLRQIDIIKEMGFGGYFMHSRTGLETEYLGEEWFTLINKCAEYGDQKGMESWLYDEDRWPSGSAGGLVTKEEKYRAMFMEMLCIGEEELEELQWDKSIAAVFACRLKDGIFCDKRLLKKGEILLSEETAVVFRLRYSACNDNYNGYCYLDTMNKEAVQRYIEVTHEKYNEKSGDKFGVKIQGIFTDEPHRGGCFTDFAEGDVNAAPYTPGMFDEFEIRFGYSLLDNLPELFLRKQPGELSKVKRDYFELCQQLFLENFAIPVYSWCKEHNLIFTGHVLHEDSLCAQSVMQGSLMRFYEYMEYPGIDLLAEHTQCYWVAKQIDSVARQLEKEWVLSELYGCTGWQTNFQSYKNIGDWQALFGINLRCPHLSWYTMKGEAKRDYPASIFHQSSWYTDYHYVEDYYSRIHAVLHDGKPECRLLVINPIESVWARAYSGAFNGLSAADTQIERLERQYAEVFHALTDNRIDFDYGEEDIMARHGRVENGILYVGACAYTKVLAAGADTLRGTTVELLKELVRQGGSVIFAGEIPAYMDAEESEEIKRLAEEAVIIPYEQSAIADACRNGQEIEVRSQGSHMIYARSMIVEGGRVVMLLNTDRMNGYDNVTVNLGSGAYAELWNARDGKITKPLYKKTDGCIEMTINLEAGGERLYLIPDTLRDLPDGEDWNGTKEIPLPEAFTYTLSEKNICVLDMVAVQNEAGIKLPQQEVLKADRALRDYYQIPYRGGEMLQPWYEVKFRGGDKELLTQLTAEYSVEISALPTGVQLVVEDLEHICGLTVNGKVVPAVSKGKWIDICFDRIPIPDEVWKEGHNTVSLIMDYYKTCGLESVYLTGSFGVEFNDGRPTLGQLPQKLSIGDISTQGLPFYSGSVIYHVDGCKDKKVSVSVEQFGGALVKLIGKEEMILAFQPHSAVVEDLRGIQVVLTRRNTFGPFHQIPKVAYAYGPANFLTEGKEWQDDYVLYEQGLLTKPVIRN
ncbi:hypothetical protein [Robinsoniella peoriensis]